MELFTGLVGADQIIGAKGGKSCSVSQQGLMVVGMAVERNPPSVQLNECFVLPVVRVGMRKQDGSNVIPGCAHGSEPCCKFSWPQTCV